MIRTQDVTNYLDKNSDLAKEIAKEAFKACRQGKIPVARAAAGVSAITGVVAAEVIGDSANPDLIDNIIDLL